MDRDFDRRRAIVIGGSVGGLFAANLLHRRGWDVRVYDRVPGSLESRGTGIAHHPETEAILARAGAQEAYLTGLEALFGIEVPAEPAVARPRSDDSAATA